MPDIITRRLGGVPLLEPSASNSETRGRERDLAQTGRLGSDGTELDPLTNSPADLRLSGVYRPPFLPLDRVEMVAAELDELAGGDRGPLPLYDPDKPNWRKAGFYEIATANVDPPHAVEPRLQQFEIALQEAGTRRDSLRSVRLNPVSVDNPFSGVAGQGVFIPASAGKTMWLDRADETTQSASAASSADAARGTVERYDAPSGLDRPALLYDIDEATDERAVVAFDTRGNADKRDNNDLRQWQAVYETGHEFAGDAVLSSDRLRVQITEGSSRGVTAERYGSGSWSAVSLGSPGNYYPLDVDLRQLGQHRAVAQIRFRESSAPDYVVDLHLDYGRNNVLVLPAADESDPMPSDLVNLFDPIALPLNEDVQPTRGLVSREVVRR